MRTAVPLAHAACLLLGIGASSATAATITVTNTDDSGPGSLRAAIEAANVNADLDIIVFSVGSGEIVITPQTQLPNLVHPVRVDGLSQPPNVNSLPRVRLDGSALSGSEIGLGLSAPACTASTCWVRGLKIVGFPGEGVYIFSGAWGIRSSFIGTDGANALGNGGSGLVVQSSQNEIGGSSLSQRNVISANGYDGIALYGNANLVEGNLIGTSSAGTAAMGNGSNGIRVFGDDNWIGGFSGGSGNVISGNALSAVAIDAGADDTLVLANRIGVVDAGTFAIGNGRWGVETAGNGTVIGLASLEANTISGNGYGGISVHGGAVGVRIWGNRIGLRRSGSELVPNLGPGVQAYAASDLQIGSELAGEGNLIAGNALGIDIRAESDSVSIRGNRIGTDEAGALLLGNEGPGIQTYGSSVVIGGSDPAERNLIAGNGYSGIAAGGAGPLEIVGNYIGTNSSGTQALPNDGLGIAISGQSVAVFSNLASGNAGGGILLSGEAVTDITIAGNLIGLNATGDAALPNDGIGIRAIEGSAIQIGGVFPGWGNIIAGNVGGNLSLEAGIDGATVAGNRIGTNVSGTAALSPQSGGVHIGGRNVDLMLNLVSGNAHGGIAISGTNVENVSLFGNFVGTNLAGTAALPNGSIGVRVIEGSGIAIGGTTPAERNLISGNASRGMTLEGGVDGAVVQGNYIGTDASGLIALPNDSDGIDIGGRNILIGGAAAGEGNLISGNAHSGIGISGIEVQDVQILGNRIGTTPNGMTALPNGSYGIRAISGAGVTIGGSQAGAGNLISGNGRGMAIEDGMIGTLIQGNIIGLNASQNAKLPNGDWSGLDLSAPDTVVGGSAPGAGNVIAGNWGSGIVLWGEASSGVVIQGNFIGTNTAGVSGLGNRLAGIQIDRSHAALIGGDGPGEGNTIAHNEFNGILQRWGDGNSFLGNRFFDNGFLAIDSEPQGPQANDAFDADGGPNFAQNHPVLGSALADGASIAVEGLLQSQPSSTYLVEFVHSPACDPSGIGEGRTSLGFLSVQTDAQGEATFAHALASSETMGVVTALATAPDGSTSEFSPCHALTGPNPGSFQFWRDPFLSWEGQPYLEVTVVRSMGNAGAASVLFETLDDSALANADYLPVSELLEFADGEVMKTIQVPIVADSLVENQEQFKVRLSAPTGGATLGAQAEVPAIIINVGADFPMYLIDDVTADEPVAGTADFTFTVTLTPSLVPQSIEYVAESATAVEGEDFEPVSGTLEFPASDAVQSQTVSVPVKADANAEPNETFYLQLSASGNIAVFKGTGIGTIRNTDPPLQDAIFGNGFEE